MRLAEYRQRWGNADAPLGHGEAGALGRWCKAQRRLRAERAARARRGPRSCARLLGGSHRPTSTTLSSSTGRRVRAPRRAPRRARRLRRAQEVQAGPRARRVGRGDAPQPERAAGCALRRLDALGFAVSSRKCGARMTRWRELRAFRDEHGHADAARVLGEAHELARWCAAMTAARRGGAFAGPCPVPRRGGARRGGPSSAADVCEYSFGPCASTPRRNRPV